ALDPQLAGEGHLAPAPVGLLGMIGDPAELFAALRIVLDDQLHRVEHGHSARSDLVQMLAHAVLEGAEVDSLVRLGYADALGEQAKALGGVAAPAAARERGHARVVPAFDVLFLDELDQ